MFKVIVINDTQFAQIETELNQLAKEGFNPIHFWNSNGRIGILLKKEQRGRPTKKVDEE